MKIPNQQMQATPEILRRCLDETPDDVAAMVGLGESLEARGDTQEAARLYRQAIKLEGPEHVKDIAKSRLTKIAENKLKSDAPVRLDAVAYIEDALDRFDKMSEKEIQDLGFEIAMLGTKGLNINDPTKTYRLKSIDGDFTGLQLVSIMYAAFQRIAPDQPVGIDLSQEYHIALGQRPSNQR